MLHLIRRAEEYGDRTAVRDGSGAFSYAELLAQSARLAQVLLVGAGRDGDTADAPDLAGARVAFMAAPGFPYVVAQWAIWRAGGVAVPLALGYPLPALRYVIEDCGASALFADTAHAELLEDYAHTQGLPLHTVPAPAPGATTTLPCVEATREALILYTSGTTGQPKGVLTTHAILEAQVTALVEAWAWHRDDRILNVLPMHHVHGIVNVTTCALWSGASVEFLPRFDAAAVLARFASGELNVFMAVPTIYYRLLEAYDALTPTEQGLLTEAMRAFRLMVSGSAALPVSVMEHWRSVSGQTLLERYGMTELGMAISNPYRGERRPGHIGQPLPGVEVRLVDDAGEVTEPGPGGIQVRGPNVFAAYWGRPDATAAAFTPDGWFVTGDVATRDDGYYRILGRASMDIIKSGGYKISALEIEEVLRAHDAVADCAVVGLPDEAYGEVVAACLVLTGALDVDTLPDWLAERLPRYKTPRRYLTVTQLPRNAMGKVTKPAVISLFP